MAKKIKDFYKDNQFIRVLALFIVILLPWLFAILIINNRSHKIQDTDKQLINLKKETSPVYHSKFDELKKPFATAKDVTAACLRCHTERGKEIMETSHWNWEKEDLKNGNLSVYIGKKTALNNFCIGTQSNEQTCTRCHIGYGWSDKSFNFKDPNGIDCLVCHDNTNTYKKGKGLAGYPESGDKGPDLNYIAQNVGQPKRQNCGVCHFWGGGGNNVKHGDMEKALISCSADLDVHMSIEGSNMTCVDCHQTINHNITGRNYSNTYSNTNRVKCEQCHRDNPHNDGLLDKHTLKVSCQTCHIPLYAKENSTVMYWDWSTAGKLDKNGLPYEEEDAFGNHTYLSIKGNFDWDRNVIPEYVWFNGTADHYLLGDSITSVPVKMNTLQGNYSCANSKIIPVKIHRGKTPYDQINNRLIQLKTFGTAKGQGAFWEDFDMIESAKKGMEYVDLPFSGKISFVETEMYMPINHMVAKKKQTVSCKECHSRNGRLKDLTGFYMPGRDHIPWLDKFGFIIFIASLIAVIIHGILRVISIKN